MNVEIGTKAAQFPEKEYINGIYVAVHNLLNLQTSLTAQFAHKCLECDLAASPPHMVNSAGKFRLWSGCL